MLDPKNHDADDTCSSGDTPHSDDALSHALRVSRSFLSNSFLERGVSADEVGRLAASDSEALRYLLQLTGSSECLVRAAAARGLFTPALDNPLAEQQLIILLDDPESWVARRAAWSLVHLICYRQGLEVPCDEAEFHRDLGDVSWKPKVQDPEISEVALKNASKSSDLLIGSLAVRGLAGFRRIQTE